MQDIYITSIIIVGQNDINTFSRITMVQLQLLLYQLPTKELDKVIIRTNKEAH